MKKTVLVLICILLTSLSCYGADYEVKSLPLPEGTGVAFVYDNNLLVKNEDENSYGIADLNGNMLTELKYYHISPFTDGESFIGYTRNSYYFGDAEFEKLYEEREKGNSKISFDSVDGKAQLSYERSELIDKKGRILSADEYENGRKFIPVDSESRIFRKEVKSLFKNNYSYEHDTAFKYPGFVILKGEDSYAAVNCGNGNVAIGKNLVMLGNGLGGYQLALITEDGKYRYCNPETEIYEERDFDSYSTYMARFVFKSGDEYFGFDEYGSLAYRGTKEISGVFGDEFIIKKGDKYILTDRSFNQVVPGEFEEIIPVYRGVYNVQEGEKRHLINGRKKVVSDMKSIGSAYYYGYFPCYTADGKQFLYDVEGRKIAEIPADALALINGENVHLSYYNKSEYIILQNGNPSVRINGKPLLSDTVCRMKNGKLLVPLNAFDEKPGFRIKASEKNVISYGIKTLTVQPESFNAEINGKKIKLGTKPQTVNGKILVALDDLSSVFGFRYLWNEERKAAEIEITAPSLDWTIKRMYSPMPVEVVSKLYSCESNPETEKQIKYSAGINFNILHICGIV